MKDGSDYMRDRLPKQFERRYKNEGLKEKIADIGMWGVIPAVTYRMDSTDGILRLKKNQPLFDFIEKYFPEDPFAFEPNMMDDRFVFLPDDVGHQGIGICVAENLPGYLEVGHFWYPCEFTEKYLNIGPGQVYIPMFMIEPGDELVEMVRKVYFEERQPETYCTFPFELDAIVRLEGDFLDRKEQSIRTIRKALANRGPQTRRNGEGLVQFMEQIMT